MATGKKPTSFKFSPRAEADLKYWKKTNPAHLKRVSDLIDAIMANPYTGIGKPKPLKYSLEGYWSRRIDSEHRIIYRITDNTIEIIALRGHYE